jgi:hypothetical protein
MYPQAAPIQPRQFSEAQIAYEQAAFLRKVYAFMAAGLGASALTAMLVVNSPTMLRFIYGTPFVFIGLLIAELVMVWGFVKLAPRMSAVGAGGLFFSYAIVNGLTLSVIFLVYQMGSIATCFYITAGTFGGMSIYGYLTKRDLSGVGHFLSMGVIGIIVAMVVNWYLGSAMLYSMISVFGVLIFVGLTAYDTQKIKQLNVIGNAGTEEDHKEAIHGALVLYLDFINLFLFILRLFGRRR